MIYIRDLKDELQQDFVRRLRAAAPDSAHARKLLWAIDECKDVQVGEFFSDTKKWEVA